MIHQFSPLGKYSGKARLKFIGTPKLLLMFLVIFVNITREPE